MLKFILLLAEKLISKMEKIGGTMDPTKIEFDLMKALRYLILSTAIVAVIVMAYRSISLANEVVALDKELMLSTSELRRIEVRLLECQPDQNKHK